MTREQAIQYDQLLNVVAESKNRYQPNIPSSDKTYQLYIELEHYGLVKLTKGGHEIIIIILTPKGKVFIKDGGFEALYKEKEQEEKDKVLQRDNWKETTKSAKSAVRTSKWSITISIIAILVALAQYIERVIAWLFS